MSEYKLIEFNTTTEDMWPQKFALDVAHVELSPIKKIKVNLVTDEVPPC